MQNSTRSLLITNPFSGREVDIYPILEIMSNDTEDHHDNTPDVAMNKIQGAIRHITMHLGSDTDMEQAQLAIHELWNLYDAFGKMGDRRRLQYVAPTQVIEAV